MGINPLRLYEVRTSKRCPLDVQRTSDANWDDTKNYKINQKTKKSEEIFFTVANWRIMVHGTNGNKRHNHFDLNVLIAQEEERYRQPPLRYRHSLGSPSLEYKYTIGL